MKYPVTISQGGARWIVDVGPYSFDCENIKAATDFLTDYARLDSLQTCLHAITRSAVERHAEAKRLARVGREYVDRVARENQPPINYGTEAHPASVPPPSYPYEPMRFEDNNLVARKPVATGLAGMSNVKDYIAGSIKNCEPERAPYPPGYRPNLRPQPCEHHD
jgi:hypothetical protein